VQHSLTTNTLFYGDNLAIMREYIPDESVDLVYLDPPFNSNRNYNVLFKDESGKEAEAQIEAFEDTWHWSHAAEETYHESYLAVLARARSSPKRMPRSSPYSLPALSRPSL
jgi:site-specific DNA-methyltransferase (adenine-specific)